MRAAAALGRGSGGRPGIARRPSRAVAGVVAEPSLELRPPGWLRPRMLFGASIVTVIGGAKQDVAGHAEQERDPQEAEDQRVRGGGGPREAGDEHGRVGE